MSSPIVLPDHLSWARRIQTMPSKMSIAVQDGGVIQNNGSALRKCRHQCGLFYLQLRLNGGGNVGRSGPPVSDWTLMLSIVTSPESKNRINCSARLSTFAIANIRNL